MFEAADLGGKFGPPVSSGRVDSAFAPVAPIAQSNSRRSVASAGAPVRTPKHGACEDTCQRPKGEPLYKGQQRPLQRMKSSSSTHDKLRWPLSRIWVGRI